MHENYKHARISLARTGATPNQKEKLDGRVSRTTVVSRMVSEIPFGIDKQMVRTRNYPGKSK